MIRPGRLMFGLCGVCLFTVSALAAGAGEGSPPLSQPINKGEIVNQFLATHPGNDFTYLGDRIERVYGPAFATGNSPQQSAEQFRLSYAGLWGAGQSDLIPVGPFEDGHSLQPIMFDQATGQYKFTGVYYSQVRDGVPVFRSRILFLTRNEPGYPLVLASADLRDIGAFHVAAQQASRPNANAGLQQVRSVAAKGADITAGQVVIFAGYDQIASPPVLAVQFVAEGGNPLVGTYQKTLFLTDAATGAIVYQENLVEDVDVTGNVSGMATQGIGSDNCYPEAQVPMPYAKVSIGLNSVFANALGNFTIPNGGSSPVIVDSTIQGHFFVVQNQAATNADLQQTVTPPGPANFIHNQLNTNDLNRAEVNGYVSANIVRDYLLSYIPAYPTINGQTGFPVNVNIASTCNAFYNGSSINFYQAGGGCSNTANSTVVYHEYGHHIISSGGSGQGAYGEGMADCTAVMVTDNSCLGDGFQTCGTCLRNANNSCQYDVANCSSCGSEIHSCGMLLSGCVWSTRNNLLATNPATYRNLISSLTFNSVLLHSGTSITPSITIDFLTLDDDNGDISDGTPHYTEINSGFSAHGMPGPALSLLKFNYPNGKPTYVSPSGGTTMTVVVSSNTGTPQPGTGKQYVNTGSGFVQSNMTQGSPNTYTFTFPAAPCGTTIKYYVSAQSTTNQTVTSPSTAPATFFSAVSAVSAGPIVFNDNFQSDLGWTATVNGASTGMWQRGTPDNCNRGNPSVDADASGMCYQTQISVSTCDTDVDGGSVILTSPNMDASQGAPIISYWRWYSNTQGADPENDVFVVEISSNGGSTWANLETVGPNSGSPNPEVDGGWFQKSFSLGSVPGFTPSNQFRIRFNASDLGLGSIVEAAVDGVKLQTLNCTSPCPADINHNNVVDVDDLLAVINAWGPCSGCPADVNGNGVVNVDDLLAVINAWGACP